MTLGATAYEGRGCGGRSVKQAPRRGGRVARRPSFKQSNARRRGPSTSTRPNAVDEAGPSESEPRPIPIPSVSEAPARLVAIGDVHGDYDAMMQALRIAEVVDDDSRRSALIVQRRRRVVFDGGRADGDKHEATADCERQHRAGRDAADGRCARPQCLA